MHALLGEAPALLGLLIGAIVEIRHGIRRPGRPEPATRGSP